MTVSFENHLEEENHTHGEDNYKVLHLENKEKRLNILEQLKIYLKKECCTVLNEMESFYLSPILEIIAYIKLTVG